MTLPWMTLCRGCVAAVVYCFLMGMAGAGTIDALFTQQDGGAIDNINTVTGVSTTLATFAADNWNGAAYDTSGGLLYVDNIAETGFTADAPIVNTIYTFNPLNPGGGITEVGTIGTGMAGSTTYAFTGAAFHNGVYYAIGTGSNTLVGYTFAGGVATQVYSQTLGGLGTGVIGLSPGDLDFIGNTLYISAATVTGSVAHPVISTPYTLYEYSSLASVTMPVFSRVETVAGTDETGVGIGYDYIQNLLIMFNADGTIDKVDPGTGVETAYTTLTGPALGGGPGDFTIVPEPSTYALWSMLLLLALVYSHRALRPRLQPCRVEA